MKHGKSFTQTFKMLQKIMVGTVAARNVTNGPHVSNRAKRPSETIPKTDPPYVSRTIIVVEKLCALIRENHRLTVREVAKEAGITESSCHTNLIITLQMYLFCCRICSTSLGS